jgi:stage V sporulation protein R
MTRDWRSHLPQLEDLAGRLGLDWSPVIFEAVPDSFMTEIAVYGLPIRMPHWSFGARYIYQLLQRHMGNSRLFEVVFPGNPGRAYLAASNGLADNILVAAHVLGHADFSKHNLQFRRSQEQGSEHIIEHAASHARQIERDIAAHGLAAVEKVLDAALALEQYIDLDRGLRREHYPDYQPDPPQPPDDAFRSRFSTLDTGDRAMPNTRRLRMPLPPNPEHDLLWFIATYAPEMEHWERDIFLAVRAESFYFYPVYATQTMNEGWASYWHARLLREADFIAQDTYLDAIKCHSDVVRPAATEEQVALAVNPYHLGFTLWEDIIEAEGIDTARQIMREDDDFSFLRNHLTPQRAAEMGLFRFQRQQNGVAKVLDGDIDELREALLLDKYNFGAPRVSVTEVRTNGTLVLQHDSDIDKRGLDTDRARKVLDYIVHVWRRPVVLKTVDAASKPVELLADPAVAV